MRSPDTAWATNPSPWFWRLHGKHVDDIGKALNAEPTAAVINEYRGRASGWGWAATGRALDEIRGTVAAYLALTRSAEIVVVGFYEWGK